MRNSRAPVREERTEGEKAVGIELGIGSNEFTFGTVGYKGEALILRILEASNWERARSDMLCHVVLTIEWIARCGRDGGYQLSIQAHRMRTGCAILMQTGSGPSLEPTAMLLRSRIRARASTYHWYTNGLLRVPWGTMGYNDPQPKGINSLGVPFLPHGSSFPYTLPSARLGIHEGVEPIGNPCLRSRCRIGWASNELARSSVVGQCLVLVLRGEPAPLQLPRSYLPVAALVCVASAASVAVAAATVQQRRCRREGIRPCLQHCKAAPQPRETGQKKRKCRSGSDGEREMKREERARKTFVRIGRDRTERERQRGARCKEMRETERRRKCVFGHVTLPLLRLAEAECVNHRPRPPFSPVT
ncbi:hypothetical protein ALC62_10708 [Cyphomyrmex costatus]|uniref:Uncharacterized protein n=1 Tax=Cyphomyrmex costatus TaxID=456900 RepID=A0A195CDF7_9HYME|nr:hypothetical protein ALC62_10708 [Cyphomyrmex costatus]